MLMYIIALFYFLRDLLHRKPRDLTKIKAIENNFVCYFKLHCYFFIIQMYLHNFYGNALPII